MMQLEICVDSLESALAAQQGGAERVELCSALTEAGLTPSLGLIRAVRHRLDIGVHVMIRPRGGDFLYSEDELAIMHDDALRAAESGADGVVFGFLTREAEVDVDRTAELVERVRPMEVTFHRALDMTRDLDRAVHDVVQTGADRLLTSGGAQSAMQGAASIERMVRSYGHAIQVMVCGGVRAENVGELVQRTGANQFHAALRREVKSQMTYRAEALHLGASSDDDFTRRAVLVEDVVKLRQAMDSFHARQGPRE